MGDALQGIFGGGERQTQDVTVDPTTKALNDMRLTQLQGLFGVSPVASYGSPRPDVYTGSPDVATLLGSANTGAPTALTGAATDTDYSDLMSLDDYINLGLSQIDNYISEIATPEILSSAALQGLEGGGYVPEAIAKATASVGLPFVQGLPGASAALTTARPQARLLQTQGNLTGAGIGLNNANVGLTDASRAGTLANRASTLFPLADYSRALSEQDLVRQQGIVTTGLTGLPYTPETSTQGRKSSQPFFNFFGQG